MTIAYYPGCLTTTLAREGDITARAMLKALGVPFATVPRWYCCGANTAPAVEPDTALALAAGNLMAAGAAASTMLAPCGVCYNNLYRVQDRIRNDEGLRSRLERRLGGEFRDDLQVVSLAEFLARPEWLSRLGESVQTPLSPFKIACYYGCMLSRPADTVGRAQSGTMENVLKAIQAEPVEWDRGAACCGGLMGVVRKEPGERLVRDILLAAEGAGANALCVACPVCHFNLDTRQFEVSVREHRRVELPVFFLSELVAGAMELKVLDSAFGRHMTSVYRLIDQFWDEDDELRPVRSDLSQPTDSAERPLHRE